MADSAVYLGFWTNWQNGRVFGATLTLTQQNGALLIAFLALFVRLSGSHLWNVIRFASHQFRSKASAQDGLYHQQQAVLRNTSSDTDALWQLVLLSWAWRSKANRWIVRQTPLILLALFHIAALALAGLFSSRAATTPSTDVLLNAGNQCGYVQFPDSNQGLDDDGLAQWSAALLDRKQGYAASMAYAKSCYNQSSSVGQCNSFVRQEIVPSLVYHAPCPFASKICADIDQGAITVDTGKIDSTAHLGINTPAADRLAYRMLFTCTPLTTDGYFSQWAPFSTPSIPGDRARYYFYGPTKANTRQPYLNYTTVVSEYGVDTSAQAYSLELAQAYAGGSALDTFEPIDDLQRSDADVFLIFLLKEAQYDKPVLDPWYLATNPWNKSSVGNTTLYVPSDPVSVLGCTGQYQLCNPNLSPAEQCTPLDGFVALNNSIVTGNDSLRLSSEQSVLARRIFDGTLGQNMVLGVLNDLDTAALLAVDQVEGISTLSTALPPDQWTKEVIHWVQINLANMQRRTVNFVLGPTSSEAQKYVIQPATDLERDLCSQQMIFSPTSMSFTVFGVALILVAGALLILLDFLLPTLVGCIQRKTKKGLRCGEEWAIESTLQLQRMAFERDDQGTWSGIESSVPVTAYGEKLVLKAISGGAVKGSRPSAGTERDSYLYSPVSAKDRRVEISPASP